MDTNVPSPASDAATRPDHPEWGRGGPCATCAFRTGTEANTSPHTVTLARLCVEGMRYFYCHEHPGLCRGFIAAMNVRGVTPEDDEEAQRWQECCGAAADLLAEMIGRAKEADR